MKNVVLITLISLETCCGYKNQIVIFISRLASIKTVIFKTCLVASNILSEWFDFFYEYFFFFLFHSRKYFTMTKISNCDNVIISGTEQKKSCCKKKKYFNIYPKDFFSDMHVKFRMLFSCLLFSCHSLSWTVGRYPQCKQM